MLLGNPSWGIAAPKKASTPPVASSAMGGAGVATLIGGEPPYLLIAIVFAGIVAGLMLARAIRRLRMHPLAVGLSKNKSHQRTEGLV